MNQGVVEYGISHGDGPRVIDSSNPMMLLPNNSLNKSTPYPMLNTSPNQSSGVSHYDIAGNMQQLQQQQSENNPPLNLNANANLGSFLQTLQKYLQHSNQYDGTQVHDASMIESGNNIIGNGLSVLDSSFVSPPLDNILSDPSNTSHGNNNISYHHFGGEHYSQTDPNGIIDSTSNAVDVSSGINFVPSNLTQDGSCSTTEFPVEVTETQRSQHTFLQS